LCYHESVRDYLEDRPEGSSRLLKIETVGNLRDLGGPAARDGRRVAGGRLFRSAEPLCDTLQELECLRSLTRVATILDIRSEEEVSAERVGLFTENGLGYRNVPFTGAHLEREPRQDIYGRYTDLGTYYHFLLSDDGYRRRIIEALRVIAEPGNHPVLFHCMVGKDRTGILAAVLLELLGVDEEDIAQDYAMTAPSMPAFMERLSMYPEGVRMLQEYPAYLWQCPPESIKLFLKMVRDEYGSMEACLKTSGADDGLFQRLRDALLEQ